MTIRVVSDELAETPYVLPPNTQLPNLDDAYASTPPLPSAKGDRLSMYGADPLDVLRAALHTPPHRDRD